MSLSLDKLRKRKPLSLKELIQYCSENNLTVNFHATSYGIEVTFGDTQ